MTNTPQHPGASPNEAWEYAMHEVEVKRLRDYISAMNEMGAQGWELVGALPLSIAGMRHDAGNTNVVEMIFKRRRGA